jgi:hypothetical protein
MSDPRPVVGIAEHEWRGKYWARWSEALEEEAGYGANTWQEAFPDSVALDRLIQVIAELGRFPTQAEIKLARREDSSFPSLRVFRRLGPQAVLAKRVIDRCQELGAHDSVVGICSPLAKRKARSAAAVASSVEIAEVYLLKSGKYFKIGRSNSTGRREYEIATQRPEGLDRIHVIRTDDPVGVEGYWHRRFADRRRAREWFDLGPNEIAAFKRWKRIL